MNWIVENWFLVVAFVACIAGIAGAIIYYVGLPAEEQKKKIRQWLIYACIEAERELQSGTGQLKLRKVWNKLCNISAFASVVKSISFDTFSEWVTDALRKAKEMLINNKTLATYVYGDNANEEIEKLRRQLSNGGTV